MPRIKYGLPWKEGINDLQIEFWMFRHNEGEYRAGNLGRLVHYQNIVKILWPDLVYTEWTHRMHEAFCREGDVILSGPASAGKSWEIARFAVIWMWTSPGGDFAVPVTSTSVAMSKRRIWAKLQFMLSSAKDKYKKLYGHDLPGYERDSSSEIQFEKGDSEHSIAIIPGSVNYSNDGVTKLKGWHAKYVLILADELQDMTDEVIASCVNMRSGTMEFKFIGCGNGCSWVNTMGRAMMPKSGNPESVSVDMDEWETEEGVCIHFDGLKSPNVLHAGKYPWNLSQDTINKIIQKHGENSIHYWQMVRGFPPPDDSHNCIVSESLLIKFNAMKNQEMAPGWEWYAGLDPAFGGDGCILKFAKVGTFIVDGGETIRMGIQFADKIEIKIIASKEQPIEFQIAEQVIAHCKNRGVKPKNFAGDGTGTGRGAMAVIREKWSNEIRVVEFGASASTIPVSSLDPTPGNEAYWNCVTEMYYSMRTFVANDQVRGVTAAMARGFGCREYTVKNGRSLLEPKAEAKSKLGRSPDEEDASVTIIDNMRYQGYFAGPMGFDRTWEKAVREASSLEAAYAGADDLLNALG